MSRNKSLASNTNQSQICECLTLAQVLRRLCFHQRRTSSRETQPCTPRQKSLWLAYISKDAKLKGRRLFVLSAIYRRPTPYAPPLRLDLPNLGSEAVSRRAPRAFSVCTR